MSKRPNKMGRIEGEPKVSRWKRVPWAGIGMLVLGVVLMWSGAMGVLKYQEFIADIKAQGVYEYKTSECEKFTMEDKSQTWFECETRKADV